MGGQHARLSPSNHRWPHCPGSVREEAAYPDIAGEAAIDGTGSHLLLELCLQDGALLPAQTYLDQVIGEGDEEKPEGWVVDRARAERVQMCLDYVARRQAEHLNSHVYAESQSNPGEWLGREDWYGTCDITIDSSAYGWLETVDYKDGRGWVQVEDNTQLISYMAGKLAPYLFDRQGQIDWNKTPIKNVRMTIVQPKTNPVVRYVEMEARELWAKAVEMKHAADKTDDPNAPLIPGKHCEWCKHGRASNCDAKNQERIQEVKPMTELITSGGSDMQQVLDLMISDPKQLTPDQLAAVLDSKSIFTKAFDSVKEEAIRRINEDGATVPGYGIGPGRATRKWAVDEEEMANKFRNAGLKQKEYYVMTLLSPAQMEKHEKLTPTQKSNLSKLITTVAGKDTLVQRETEVKEVKESAAMTFMEQAQPAPQPVPAKEPEPAEAPAPVAPLSFM